MTLLKEPAYERLTVAQIGQLESACANSRQLNVIFGVRPVNGLAGAQSHTELLLRYIEGES